MQGFAVDSRDYGFWTSQKCGTNLNPASSKSERGSDTATICNATGSDNRDTYGVYYLRKERHGANQACAIARGKGPTMPACLKTLGDDGVHTCRLQLSGFRNGRRRALPAGNGRHVDLAGRMVVFPPKEHKTGRKTSGPAPWS